MLGSTNEINFNSDISDPSTLIKRGKASLSLFDRLIYPSRRCRSNASQSQMKMTIKMMERGDINQASQQEEEHIF